MTKGFVQGFIRFGLLAVLIVITALNVWQAERIEAKQIQVLDRLSELENQLESGAFTANGSSTSQPRGGIFGVAEPDYVTKALMDPANTLKRDPTPWLPADAKKGGTLNLLLGTDPKGLNFLTENGNDVTRIQTYVGTGLVSRHKKDDSQYGPELAYFLSETVREDGGSTYLYKLREDFTWHEPTLDFSSGEFDWLKGEHKVTAHDLVFMIDMLMNDQVSGAAPLRSYYDTMTSWKALDDYTLEVQFSEHTYSNRQFSRSFYPMPEFLYAFDEEGNRYDDEILGQRFQDHWYNPNTIGSGPYRFVAFEPGVKLELERYSKYPLGGNAHERILFQILKDQNHWPRKLRTGELHLSYIQPAQYRSEYLEADEDSPFKDGTLKHGEYWEHTYFYVGWNADKPWFGDKRVRKAMSYAFNADLILNEVFLGLGERCTGPMPSFLPYYDDSLPPIPFDLEKAKALLDEAGWIDSDGDGIRDKEIEGALIPFDFALMVYGSSDEYKVLGNIYKEDLAKIGVRMNVRAMEWSNLLKRVDDREFDAVTLAWVSSPDVDFYQIWHSSQADIPKGSNRVGFRNEKADELIMKIREEFAYPERVRLAKEFHQLLYEEQPYTFFYTRKRPAFWQKELKNVWFSRTRPYLKAHAWYLSQ